MLAGVSGHSVGGLAAGVVEMFSKLAAMGASLGSLHQNAFEGCSALHETKHGKRKTENGTDETGELGKIKIDETGELGKIKIDRRNLDRDVAELRRIVYRNTVISRSAFGDCAIAFELFLLFGSFFHTYSILFIYLFIMVSSYICILTPHTY